MRISLGVCLIVLGTGCAHVPEPAQEPAPQQAEASTDDDSRSNAFYSLLQRSVLRRAGG